MADRLKFTFIRQASLTQIGIASLDVKDPTDPEEIAEKLKTLDFTSFVVTEETLEDPTWSYQPYIEDMNEET